MAARPIRTILRAAVVSLALVGTSLAVTPAASAAPPVPTLLPLFPSCGTLLTPPCPVPPDTTITGLTPAPNADNWVNKRAVEVTFTHSYPGEAPEGQTTYECRLQGPSATSWAACASPATFSGLPDTDRANASSVHRVEVRAVHPTGTVSDASPAAVSFRLDATRPRMVEIYNSPDLVGPGPFGSILLANRIEFTYVASGNPTSYRCTFNGRNRSCPDTSQNAGRHTIEKLSPGSHRFTAVALDQADNTAPNPLSVDFAVPYNRVGTKKQIRRMWSRVAAHGHYRGDYVTTRKNGSFLSRRFTNFTEAYLVVAKGPRHGRIRVDLGNTRVKVQRLGAKKFRTKQLVKLNIPEGRAVSGRIKVTVISPDGRPVMIDAIVVR